ncbi:MAG: Mitochondrial inner membrane protein oxa1 [Chaenotheca gracillima]|nr:MAG: Mitochondrial inner membrane protein oxa1 [Chaenotheca gracillima]
MDRRDGFQLYVPPDLRIPGHHFPPLVYGLAVVYASSFAKQLSRQFGESTSARGKEKKNETRDSPSSSPYNLRSKDKDEVDTSGDGEDADESAQGPNVAQVLLLGLPSPRYLVWSAVTVAVNLLLVLGVVDYIYRGPQWHPSHDVSFARVGYVSPNAAKILVREPDLSQLPIYLSYRKGSGSTDDAWKAGGKINVLSEDTDFTQALTISRLSAETQYQYTLSTNHSGHFKTAPSAGRSPAKEDGGKFTFLTSSCIKPNFPYNPISHPLSIPGFRHLAARLPELGAHFMLFLGDFIYIDVPKRLGVDVETYRREYRMVYNSPDWPSVSEDLPWLHVLDDHEIQNDWDGNTTGVYQAAADPWIHYHTSVNPPAVRPGASYFSFAQGPASFFMMDTRRYRSPEFAAPNDAASKTMLGKQQLDDLLLWLRKPEPEGVKWKIIASSIPFTKNWRFGDSDTWAGYLSERQCVLEAMWDVGLRGGVGVVVISGDRHEFAATSFPPPPGKKWPLSATVHEFSTSPLSQFYLPVRTYRQEDDEDVTIK